MEWRCQWIAKTKKAELKPRLTEVGSTQLYPGITAPSSVVSW
jgi:hypothetical protein